MRDLNHPLHKPNEGPGQGTADKRALRAHYIGLRNALDDEFRHWANAAIQGHVLQWLDQLAAEDTLDRRVVGLYRAHRGEVNLFPLVDVLSASGWTPAFPVTDPESRSIAFHRVDTQTKWQRGPFGIWEPTDGHPVELAELGVLLVPGVAFTAGGLRLGYGGGYYDRLFATPNLHAVRAGVAFSCQLADALPTEPHDAPMHYVITEQGVIRCEPLP